LDSPTHKKIEEDLPHKEEASEQAEKDDILPGVKRHDSVSVGGRTISVDPVSKDEEREIEEEAASDDAREPSDRHLSKTKVVKTDGAKHIDDDDKDEVVCHKKKDIDEVHAKAIAKMKAKTDNAVEAVKDMQEEMAKLLKDHNMSTHKNQNDLDSPTHKKIEEDLPHKEEASEQAEKDDILPGVKRHDSVSVGGRTISVDPVSKDEEREIEEEAASDDAREPSDRHLSKTKVVKTDGAKHIDDDDKDEVVCHKKKDIDEVHAKAIAKMKAKTDNAVEAVKDMQEEMAKLLKDHNMSTHKNQNDLDSPTHKKIEEDLPHKEEASEQAENTAKATAQIKKYSITNAQTKPPKRESIAEKLEKAKENSEALDSTINSVNRAMSVEDIIANSINNTK
jgi:hypothetical protein